MTMLFRAELSIDVSSVSSMLDRTESQKVMRSGFIILQDCHHHCKAVSMLQVESRYPWTNDHLRGNLIIRRDGAAILLLELPSSTRSQTHRYLS